MDGLAVLLVVVLAFAALGVCAALFGVDSREQGDDAQFRAHAL